MERVGRLTVVDDVILVGPELFDHGVARFGSGLAHRVELLVRLVELLRGRRFLVFSPGLKLPEGLVELGDLRSPRLRLWHISSNELENRLRKGGGLLFAGWLFCAEENMGEPTSHPFGDLSIKGPGRDALGDPVHSANLL